MLSSKSVLRYVGVGDLNTEDHPRLEYGAPGAFFVNTGVSQLAGFDERMQCDSVPLQLKRLMENNQLTNEELRNIGFYHTNQNNGCLLFGFSVLHEIQKKFPKDAALLERLANASEQLNLNNEALMYRKMLMELEPENPNALANYAWLKYIDERKLATVLTPIDMKESENILKKSILLVADTVDIFSLQLADLYYGIQQYAQAIPHYKRVIELRKTCDGDPTIHDDLVLMQLARCHSRLNQYSLAFGYAMQAVNGNPKNEEARDMIYEIWTKGMNPTKRR